MTKRALIQRINRKLAAEDEVLRAARGMQAFLSLGQYYTVDVRQNTIARKGVDPVALGRALGVLQPYETVID